MTANLKVPTGAKAIKGLQALADLASGQKLSEKDQEAAEYAHKKLVEALGPIWAKSIPADRLGKMVGKQSSQLNTFAGIGIRAVESNPIDLPQVVQEAFKVLADNRKVIAWQQNGGNITETIADLDRVTSELDDLQGVLDRMAKPANGDGEADTDEMERAKLRRLQAQAADSEHSLRQKTGELVRAAEIAPLLTIVADRIRQAGDAIGQQFGPDAQRIVAGAIDEAERRLLELRKRQRPISDEPEDAT